LQVGYVDRPSFKRDSGCDGVTSRFDRVAFDEIDDLGRSVIESDPVIGSAIAPKHYSAPRLA
jgi:hypothetical protein